MYNRTILWIFEFFMFFKYKIKSDTLPGFEPLARSDHART
jgi:hypothetical protein